MQLHNIISNLLVTKRKYFPVGNARFINACVYLSKIRFTKVCVCFLETSCAI